MTALDSMDQLPLHIEPGPSELHCRDISTTNRDELTRARIGTTRHITNIAAVSGLIAIALDPANDGYPMFWK